MHSFVLAQMNPLVMVAIIAVIVILALIFFAVFARFISLYIQCWMTGADISLPHLVMMTIRKVNPAIIDRAKIIAVQAGLTEV